MIRNEKNTQAEFYLGEFSKIVANRLDLMERENFPLRLWRKDPFLWKSDPASKKNIENSMGWLDVVGKMQSKLDEINNFVKEVKTAGYSHAVLIGMGGSSLAPIVLQRSFADIKNDITFFVLDTTDPQTILNTEKEIDIEKTLFIIASKSGTTSEIAALFEYFFDKVKSIKADKAGENFCTITDPGTAMVDIALQLNFRHIFRNYSDIGGRYSALSYFGLVPAAFLGININLLLERAQEMVHNCASYASITHNPGILLGTALGELALKGKDKVTFIVDNPISSFGLWLEQLIAESTGKEGKGILPIEGEALLAEYGNDRVFVYLKQSANKISAPIAALKAKHPLIVINIKDAYDLGKEFFRWEIATATAGSILKINPFDQPNVQENKDITARLLQQVQEQKYLPLEEHVFTTGTLSYYISSQEKIDDTTILRDALNAVKEGSYISIQAYITETPEIENILQEIRLNLSSRFNVPVTIGYGPRFLHSTGQYHKGGPGNGVFIQLTAANHNDVQIPGRSYTFGTLKLAQAKGDFEVLTRNNRKIIRVDLGANITLGLMSLKQSMQQAVTNTSYLKIA